MKPPLILVFVGVILLTLSLPLFSVSAHQFGISNNIEVSIHVSPNDQPVALQPSHIEIEVEDETRNFNFSNCDCLLKVIDKETTLVEITVYGDGAKTETQVTFANAGEYRLVLSGMPKANAEPSFQPFELSFNYVVRPVPVAKEPESEQSSAENSNKPVLYLSLILLTVLVLLVIVVTIKKRGRSSDKTQL